MDGDDEIFVSNKDWDPSYLYELFKEDFFDFEDMSISETVSDGDLVKVVESVENGKYCPEVEDISFDDDALCSAVEKIEKE